MNDFRLNTMLCDVTIKLEYNGQKKKFSAHKLVLAACSPYFKAMFTGKFHVSVKIVFFSDRWAV